MSYKVITISREFGSGGRTVGKQLAEKLGVPCYDREIVEKVALYLIGAFLCGIDPANIAGVMEAAASREPFVNLFTQPSARYVINISFFNWAYIVCGILFSALCIVFLSKARKVTAA